MTEINQIWKCNVCGNIIEVVHQGADSLVCCGQSMELLIEKTKEEGNEKHKPVIEKNDEGVKVSIGSVPHPMEEEHFIEWVEIETSEGVGRKFLKPGMKPEVMFPVKEQVSARAYCNVHGLWKS